MPLAAGAKLGPYQIARDAKALVYSVFMVSSELHLVDGLK